MNIRFLRSLQFILAIIDFITINLVFFSARFVFQSQGFIGTGDQYDFFGLFLGIAWLSIVLIENIYTDKFITSFEQYARIYLQTYIYYLLLTVAYLFFFRLLLLSRVFITVILIMIFVALLINRFVFAFVHKYMMKREGFVSKVVVIGYNNLSKKLVDYLEKDEANKQIVGFCENADNIEELSNYPILSNVADTMETCKQYQINEIYSTIAPEHNKDIYALMRDADQNCIRFKIVPDLGFFINKKMHVDYVEGLPVMSLRHEPLEDINNIIKKRTFDIIVSLLVTVFILSWLIPIVGLLIWIESKGPIFFVQPRSGKNNKDFMCLKFRSMHMNSQANLQQATRDDARITTIGKFLRRTSLDEFPQFINVLKGDMSIVGPRPHMLKHTDEYSRLIEEYMVRQFLKPGITGWAQVNGYRGETTNVWQMKKRVEHDLWYLENWSLVLDVKIVLMTALNTIKGEENAF